MPLLCLVTLVYTAGISDGSVPTPAGGRQQQQTQHPLSRTCDDEEKSLMRWYLVAASSAVKA